jgi:hypothetical protein
VAGLGGREINRATFRRLVEDAMRPGAEVPPYTLVDVRVS